MEYFVKKDHILHLQHFTNVLPNVEAGFSTIHGGVSRDFFSTMNLGLHVHDEPFDVVQNRDCFAKAIGTNLEHCIYMNQIHGKEIVKVDEAARGAGTKSETDVVAHADGIYTTAPNTVLVTLYADCVPLYFLDKKQKKIGLAHAGWKGTTLRIAQEMLQLWQKEGSQLEDIEVAIGPSIGSCCYEVSNDVVHAVQSLFNGQNIGIRENSGSFFVDLKEVNRSLFLQSGLHEQQITVSNYCTSCEKDLFFSHRRDHGKTGRMASYIFMKSEE